MVSTDKDYDRLRPTNLKKLPIFSRCVVRDVAPLTRSSQNHEHVQRAKAQFCGVSKNCRTYMHGFHFLDFLFQRFIERSSKSSKDKIKCLVYVTSFCSQALSLARMIVKKKQLTYTLYRKSTRRVISGMMKREIQNTAQEYNIRSCKNETTQSDVNNVQTGRELRLNLFQRPLENKSHNYTSFPTVHFAKY